MSSVYLNSEGPSAALLFTNKILCVFFYLDILFLLFYNIQAFVHTYSVFVFQEQNSVVYNKVIKCTGPEARMPGLESWLNHFTMAFYAPVLSSVKWV